MSTPHSTFGTLAPIRVDEPFPLVNNGATVTNPVQPIVMTFSQALDPATVNSSTLQVMDTWNSNRGLPGTYTVGAGVNANQVTFVPTNPYPSGAQITVGECGGPTDILGDVFQNGSCYNQELVYFMRQPIQPVRWAIQRACRWYR